MMKAFGKDQIGDADVRLVAADLAQRRQPETVIGRLDLDARARKLAHDLRHRHLGVFRLVAEHPAVALVGILVLEEAVQERGVHRIDADFERLQPVAIDHALEREGVGGRRDEAIEVRKCRRLAVAEIGPQDAALLHHRIGLLLDVGAEVAVVGLRRRLQALAVDVEQPAVKRAAQAAVFQPAVSEIGAAMRAVPADQSVAALLVLEDDEVFAEQPHRLHRPVGRELIDQRGRLPVAAHQRAGGGAGIGAGDQVVLFRAEHCFLILAISAA